MSSSDVIGKTKVVYSQSTTTMALSVVHHLHSSWLRIPRLSSTVTTRRAMVSTCRNRNYRTSTHPQLADQPPVALNGEQVATSSSMSADAGAPQTAAPPPPAPRAERPRPKIHATKAALTLVCVVTKLPSNPRRSDPGFFLYRHRQLYIDCVLF